MIIVCPLNKVPDIVAERAPASVISILDKTCDAPALPDDIRHLKLALSMAEAMCPSISGTKKSSAHIDSLIAFAKDHNWSRPLLIHCQLGQCRSPAAAYIIMCALSAPGSEQEKATILGNHLTGIDPCLSLVMNGDDFLNRDGAMIDAIAEMDCTNQANCGQIREIPFTPAA